MSESYGYAYLTSYGWTGLGTGLRKDSVDKPLAIPPKKNLNGLGKDRDDGFPFWDHLFTAASKAITIKVSTDDEDVDDTRDPSPRTDTGFIPLQRTTTGIISSRRPTLSTPASTSGNTTPDLNPDVGTPGPLSLLATAKREAAKRSLYSRFFRGPVLGLDGDLRMDNTPYLAPSPISSPRLLGDQDSVVEETKKRMLGDKTEMKEERRERRRLKRERKAMKAAKRLERALKRTKTKQNKDWLDRDERGIRERQDKEIWSEENETFPYPKQYRKQTRKSVSREGDELEPLKCARKRLEEDITLANDRQQITSHRRSNILNVTGAECVVSTTRKKKRKRKDTPS